jgi:hypothetical protein
MVGMPLVLPYAALAFCASLAFFPFAFAAVVVAFSSTVVSPPHPQLQPQWPLVCVFPLRQLPLPPVLWSSLMQPQLLFFPP